MLFEQRICVGVVRAVRHNPDVNHRQAAGHACRQIVTKTCRQEEAESQAEDRQADSQAGK
jgi:hypothetical protein